MDITVLQNQVVIMKALLSISDLKSSKELEERIKFTEARIRALS